MALTSDTATKICFWKKKRYHIKYGRGFLFYLLCSLSWGEGWTWPATYWHGTSQGTGIQNYFSLRFVHSFRYSQYLFPIVSPFFLYTHTHTKKYIYTVRRLMYVGWWQWTLSYGNIIDVGRKSDEDFRASLVLGRDGLTWRRRTARNSPARHPKEMRHCPYCGCERSFSTRI